MQRLVSDIIVIDNANRYFNLDFTGLSRDATKKKKISLRRTTLEGLCPPREPPQCVPATQRYRTHDGTCNNFRRSRWGSAQLPFHRFISPEYSDGLESVRNSVTGVPLPSARFVSLVVHGYRDEEAPITMLLPQWGQLIDHDITATLQPRSINGTIPRCCQSSSLHPSCMPIKVPRDDPFLGSLGVRCLEFLRSAPAQRRNCFLSWREQTNQVTSYIDGSAVYSSNPRTADSSRMQRDGLLLLGRGPQREDACLRGGFGHQCIRAGDSRAGEQPGLLALHTVFVAEHNRISLELSDLNPHWSDEKLYQETRRIIGAIFQHITYREFLPLVLGKDVCRLFDLELLPSGYYKGYDPKVNPTVANAFSAAAFRFGHALVQGSIMRSDVSYRFIDNNVTLHDENSRGDIGGIGSLHRIIRGMATQRTLKRDEFMSPELTNHLFQSDSFPFGMDLAAINIQRGRDHGLPAYVEWRHPCGLTEIKSWEDLETVAGPKSAERMRRAYDDVADIDLFVGGISERPVVGGLVGPTFACIIAQQFSNLRRGDRFWYENSGFESSFTPAQLSSIRQVTLSQILCRSLGSSNFMQPHAFIPADFTRNERLRCGTGILAPIDLFPWAERDNLNKEGGFPTISLIPNNHDIFMSVGTGVFSSRPETTSSISNNIDFITKVPTKRPSFDHTSTTVSNKLDLPKTTRPRRKRTTTTTTRRTTTKFVNNKLDFDTNKKTESPFSKLTKDSENSSNSTKVKRSTDVQLKRLEDFIVRRSDILTVNELKNNFKNLDNATRYLNNKPMSKSPRIEVEASKAESRLSYDDVNFKQYYDNDFDYGDKPQRPTYDYSSRPNTYFSLYPPVVVSKRPLAYQNNRPSYEGNDYSNVHQLPRPTHSPISNKHSTPFSYDTYDIPQLEDVNSNSGSPQINYDNMVIPLYVSPNRPNRPTYQSGYKRPTYSPTRRADLSTFLFIETTRPNFNGRRTTKFPLSLSASSRSPSYSYHSSLDSSDTSDDYSINNSHFISPSKFNKISIKLPSLSRDKLNNPFSSDTKTFSVFSYDSSESELNKISRPHDLNDDALTKKHKTSSYNDYSQYNDKQETSTANKVKYFYVHNVLHEQFEGKSDESGLYDQQQTKRYAENYDKHLSSDRLDGLAAMTRTLTHADSNDNNKKSNETIDRQTKLRQGKENIFLVPFKVLTKIERPDNWVTTEVTDNDTNLKLPEVPTLKQDGNIARELPRPILRRKASNKS
ncbi:CLUMA_CG017012, isoform A [Clunio marinus]|uniref:CLUMA_CG017012, isoform A n=1 Tax=Clunio marinus TaxID=568069 RepID=A0A1J1IUV4_9DIPT|nr:CLUMA_CG017012, isoform A [Clunio marinus]